MTRSNLRRRRRQRAVGVMVGSLAPRAPAPPRLRCLFPTRGGGTGGSNFFFFCISAIYCGGRRDGGMSGMKSRGGNGVGDL